MASDTLAETANPRRRRTGGRAGNQRRSGATSLAQAPWDLPLYSDAPSGPLDEEGVNRIHDAAMRILEEIGIWFLNEEAQDVLITAGCEVEKPSGRVRMDRAFVMEKVALAPESFPITPRNGERRIVVGGKHALYVNVSSPPNCSDLERGRRTGTRESMRELLMLTQAFNCLHLAGGYPVEPIDLHASTRHLDALFDKLTLTDKVVHAYSLGKERIEDAMEMVRIAGGLSHAEFEAEPRMYTNINSSSPLKHDYPMLDGAMRMARRGQPVIVTPFTLAGAMAPVTLAGAVAQQTAEALAAIALLQCVKPGVPVGYGSFTSNVDMKSGAPAFGTPEYLRATQMSGQMARFYCLPFRASNACAANAPDPQAAWESAFSLWACTSAQANIVYHAAGWLEGGLTASYEKFVMDCEMLQQVQHAMRPVSVTEDDLAVDAIAEVGPEGHFFGGAHTQARYESAFYSPFLSDWRNYEAWQRGGGLTAPERALGVWKKILAEFEAPAMDEAIREELSEFVERRRREGGAPTDF